MKSWGSAALTLSRAILFHGKSAVFARLPYPERAINESWCMDTTTTERNALVHARAGSFTRAGAGRLFTAI
jgi:hypothetical protein